MRYWGGGKYIIVYGLYYLFNNNNDNDNKIVLW